MCVNNLSKVALDSAAAGIEPATSSRKSNALTTAPPSHTYLRNYLLTCVLCDVAERRSDGDADAKIYTRVHKLLQFNLFFRLLCHFLPNSWHMQVNVKKQK